MIKLAMDKSHGSVYNPLKHSSHGEETVEGGGENIEGEVAFGPDKAFFAPIWSFLIHLSQLVDMVGYMCAF